MRYNKDLAIPGVTNLALIIMDDVTKETKGGLLYRIHYRETSPPTYAECDFRPISPQPQMDWFHIHLFLFISDIIMPLKINYFQCDLLTAYHAIINLFRPAFHPSVSQLSIFHTPPRTTLTSCAIIAILTSPTKQLVWVESAPGDFFPLQGFPSREILEHWLSVF